MFLAAVLIAGGVALAAPSSDDVLSRAAERAGLTVVDEGDGVVVVRPLASLVDEENARETFVGALESFQTERARSISARVMVVDGGGLRALGHARVEKEPSEASKNAHRPTRRAPGEKHGKTARLPFGGALVGLRVAVSAGHGWLSDGAGGWRTQRDNFRWDGCGSCRGITEDFFTAETMTNQIIPLLERMGAEVIEVREIDHDESTELVLDDGADSYAESEGVWSDGSTAGVSFDDGYRVNADTDPGRAVFTVAPVDGARRVSIRFPEGTNRTTAAIVSVVDEGGVRTIDLDQTRMGRYWLDLGAFSFASAGGSVELAHGPATGFLIADAVKVGGGVDPESRKPWWQMGAQFYVPSAGAPADVVALNDVTIRPGYAEFVGPDVFISVHANATGAGAGSTTHGTSTYRYSCGLYGDHSPSDDAVDCDDPPGSRDLDDAVHAAVVGELQATWDPGWKDLHKLVADFGELRVLDDTPGILIETGFFDDLVADTPGVSRPDNESLHDPRWRERFARGLVRGVANFLAPGSNVPPERVDGVAARNQSDGTLVVSWNGVAGASGYRVYKSRIAAGAADGRGEGRAFDTGTLVNAPATSLTLDGAALDAGAGYAFRIAALDANGEGEASQAVVARFRGTPSSSSTAPILVVEAYDRRDAFVQGVDNDLMTAVEHGCALEGIADFDGALDEVVEAGVDGAGAALELSSYALVDFAAGKDSVEHEAISRPMREKLAAYLDGGGAVIASGEELGYALVEAGNDTGGTDGDVDGAAFFAHRFGAAYVADDAATYDIAATGPLAGVFDGVAADNGPARLDDGTAVYDVVFPDVWQVADGADADVALLYGGTGAPDTGALVLGQKTALLGAGLEAIVPNAARAALVRALVESIAPAVLDAAEGEGEGEGDAGEGEGDDGEGEGEGDITIATAPPKTGCGCGAAGPVDAGAGCAVFLALALVRRRRWRTHDVRTAPAIDR